MLEATTRATREWLTETEPVPLLEPAAWPLGLWLLLAAFVLLLIALRARRRARRPLHVRPPQVLITQGELVPDARTGRLGSGTLTMTVSNLGRYPIQLMETASRTGGAGRFGVADTPALVPAMGEVEVHARLPVGKLEDGLLDLYCYAAATRTKIWRHRAELTWEPWAKRFKVPPLEQRVEPVRALASERRDVVRMDDVIKAEQLAAQQSEASARHERSPRRRQEAGGSPRSEEPASLVALLGARRAPLVNPPGGGPAGREGATARSSRTPAESRPETRSSDAAEGPRAASPEKAAPRSGVDTDDADAPKRTRAQPLEFPEDF